MGEFWNVSNALMMVFVWELKKNLCFWRIFSNLYCKFSWQHLTQSWIKSHVCCCIKVQLNRRVWKRSSLCLDHVFVQSMLFLLKIQICLSNKTKTKTNFWTMRRQWDFFLWTLHEFSLLSLTRMCLATMQLETWKTWIS